MATIQIQKTATAGTMTKTAIDQKQSLEVVQTMLHGGLSTLSYLRNFFADKAYDEQAYESSERILPYEDYASGKVTKGKMRSTDQSTNMRVLRRGRSKRVDMFLDWLEVGAFTALKANNLRSLQIYVHADPKYREKVIETYTFNIKYIPHADDGKRVLAGLEMDSPSNSLINVGATNASLQFLFREIMNLCKALPDLPEQRYISMALFYVQETARKDQPNGFVPNPAEPLMLAEAEGWNRHVQQVKELQSGFHNTSLKISFLQQKSFLPRIGIAGLPPPAIPATLKYTALLDPHEIIEEVASGEGVDDAPLRAHAKNERASTNSAATIAELETIQQPARTLTNPVRTNGIATPLPTSDAPEFALPQHSKPAATDVSELTRSQSNKQLDASQLEALSSNTQSSNIPEMKKALNGMMQQEYMTQGDTQTQWYPPPQQSESTEIPDLSDLSPSKETDLGSPVRGTKPMLSQSVAKLLGKAKPNLHQTARRLAKAPSTKGTSDIVLCQCGHDEDEGDMVNCSFCGTWQHLHCYGYSSARDPRLPTEHVCYQCLLGGSEEQTLKQLSDLAVKRRGMHFALQHGLKSQRDFATDMDLPTAIANPLYQHLKKEGYVTAASGSHRAGFAAAGKPQFVPVKDGPNHEKMLRNLFDPLMHISHLYEVPDKLDTQPALLTQQLLATQAPNMPPPTTPASQLKRDATKTPGTALDMRASMTPFQTPSRPRRREPPASKRLREEDDEIVVYSPKRHAPSSGRRFKSVQTEFILDAAGLSSSPAGPILGY